MRDDGRWLPVVVDLAEPLADLPAAGAVALHVTALWRGQPLGNLVLDVGSDPYPAALLGPALHDAFAEAAAQAEAEHVARGPLAAPTSTGSVVVCTRNRFDSLRRCLASLTRLTALSAGRVLEVVVVDNGDGDEATRDMVEGFGFRCVHEPLAGLDRARNRGLLEARADVVLYTDDDVEVDRSWADELLRCFDSPLVAVATGLVLPAVLDTHHQRTFEQHAGFSRGVRRRVLDGARTEPTKAGVLGAGASMAFRRTLMRSLGGFPEALDAGMPTKTGGDTYGLYRVLRAGWTGVYEPRALAFHWHRDGPDELVRTLTGYSTGAYSFLGYAALRDRDPAAVRAMASWTRTWQGPRVVGALLRRPGAPPLELAWAEVRGVLATPRALRAALRLARERGELVVAPAAEPEVTPVTGDVDLSPRGPSVSVVIDARGRSSVDALSRALEEQTAPPLEVLLVVDPLRPTSASIDRPAAARGMLPGGRQVGSHDEAARVARADVLLLLDGSDVPLSRDVVAAHLAEHAGRPAPVAVIGPREPTDVPERPYALARRNLLLERAAALRAGRPASIEDVVLSNLSLPRTTLLAVGGLPGPPPRAGRDLGRRLQQAGVPLVAAPAAPVRHSPMVCLAAGLEQERRRGAADVEIARRHPEGPGELSVTGLDRLGPKRRAAVRGLERAAWSRAALVAVLPTLLRCLELVRSREGVARDWDHAAFLSYMIGAVEGAGSDRTPGRRAATALGFEAPPARSVHAP